MNHTITEYVSIGVMLVGPLLVFLSAMLYFVTELPPLLQLITGYYHALLNNTAKTLFFTGVFWTLGVLLVIAITAEPP